MSIFISHTHEDTEFVEKLKNSLFKFDITTFSYRDILSPGDSIYETLAQSVNEADGVIFVVSKAAAKNMNFESEVALSISARLQGKDSPLIPVLADSNALIPAFLADLQYLDMSNSERYDAGLPLLIQALTTPVFSDLSIQERQRWRVEYTSAQQRVLRNRVEEFEYSINRRKVFFRGVTLFRRLGEISIIVGGYFTYILIRELSGAWSNDLLPFVAGAFAGLSAMFVATVSLRFISVRLKNNFRRPHDRKLPHT